MNSRNFEKWVLSVVKSTRWLGISYNRLCGIFEDNFDKQYKSSDAVHENRDNLYEKEFAGFGRDTFKYFSMYEVIVGLSETEDLYVFDIDNFNSIDDALLAYFDCENPIIVAREYADKFIKNRNASRQ